MLRDNIQLIISLAAYYIHDIDPSTQEGKDYRETLEYVANALSDIQTDNQGQFIIYTGIKDDSKPGGYYESDLEYPSGESNCQYGDKG